MALVCEALENDPLVQSLWLKRNPLLAAGMVPVSKLLRANVSTLVTLDVVNCGILDKGLLTLLDGLKDNHHLQHMYVHGAPGEPPTHALVRVVRRAVADSRAWLSPVLPPLLAATPAATVSRWRVRALWARSWRQAAAT